MKKFEKIEKIGFHSNLKFECKTERGFKESLSIALGFLAMHFIMDEKGCAKRVGKVPVSCIFFAKLDDVPL